MEDSITASVAAIEGQEETKEAKPKQDDSDDEVRGSSDVTEFINRYTVDIITEYQDTADNLMLHWAVGKKNAGEWKCPDDSVLPAGSKRWPDNIAT